MLYLDSSALAKRYAKEIGSQQLNDRLGLAFANDEQVVTSVLSYADIHAALARKFKDGSLKAADYHRATIQFQSDWRTYITQIELSQRVLSLIPKLVERHPLRGSDAVQIASALWAAAYTGGAAETVVFVTADKQLAETAENEELDIFNPELA